IGISLYVQLHLEETPAFRELQAIEAGMDKQALADRHEADQLSSGDVEIHQGSPVIAAIRSHPREIVLAAGAFVCVQVSFYIMIAFVVAYGSNPAGLGLDRNILLAGVLIGSMVQVPFQFMAAAWSDTHGRKGIYSLGAICAGVWGFAMFPLIDTGNFWLIVLALAIGQIFIGMMYGPQAAFLAELFSTKVRYSGASMGYQLGAIVGGALAPIIATTLWAELGTIYISAYIALSAVVTLISVRLLAETSGQSLEHKP
ncbi:MAG: MFS transporter, partial [Pseudomonadales bacterium]|nr:MFS transporter [Pseudomonadales bacterium]